MPTPTPDTLLPSLCGIGTLTVSEMVRHSRHSPRQAECLFETWLQLRRDSLASHAMHKEGQLAPTEALVMERLETVESGRICCSEGGRRD